MKTKKNLKNKGLNISSKMNNKLIDILKGHINKMDIKFEDKNFSKLIYNKIVGSFSESIRITHDYNLVDFKNKKNLSPSMFFDKSIIDHIYKTINYEYNVKFSYKSISFFINIYSVSKINIEKYILYIKTIICLCLQEIIYDKKENFTLDLYLTDKKKSIPYDFQNKIVNKHINSGYSSYNDEMYICIYRKEEWLKVFIHECFHAFNMDFHQENIKFKNIFSNLFNIKSNFLVFESFVEFWARILNCGIFSYLLKPNMNFNDFNTIFILNLNIERIHSLLQASKLLTMFQLKYSDIISKDKTEKEIVYKTYNEQTNAFCYYVITALLMNNFDKTINWFDLNHNNLFNFDKTERQVVIFCFYIKQLAEKKQFIDIMNELNIHNIEKENYMNMVIFETVI